MELILIIYLASLLMMLIFFATALKTTDRAEKVVLLTFTIVPLLNTCSAVFVVIYFIYEICKSIIFAVKESKKTPKTWEIIRACARERSKTNAKQ